MSSIFCNKTKIILGLDAIEQLGPNIKQAGVKTVLCVYGSGSAKKNGVYERVCKTLADNGIEFKEMWGVQPNPLISKVREGIAICKDPANKIDAVLAVGGGSVIDSSKAIAAGALYEHDIYDYYLRKTEQPKKMLPLFTVLTLSATGSEFNFGSVVSDPELHTKIGTFYPQSPVASAIDPSVQQSLPWRQVVCGATDALSHLMESMFHKDTSHTTTRQVNFGLQRAVMQCMDILCDHPDDTTARLNFCWAASLALNGLPHFQNCGDWNVHYMEHCVSVLDDHIAHGEGLAVLSAHYYPFMHSRGVCVEQLKLWSKEVMGEDDPVKAFAKYKEMLRRWKAPLTLPALGITDEKAVDTIAGYFEEHSRLVRSPVFPLSREDCKEVLMSCLKE